MLYFFKVQFRGYSDSINKVINLLWPYLIKTNCEYLHHSLFMMVLQFHNAEDAKKALEQLNGFELAGRPMKVGHVTERQALEQGATGSVFDTDEMDRAGIDLGATGRLQLMAKLAEGTYCKDTTFPEKKFWILKNVQYSSVANMYDLAVLVRFWGC